MLHVGSNNPKTKYTMTKGDEKSQLAEVQVEKDLGVILDEKLSFEKHILTKVAKANQTLGIIRRTFRYLDREGFMLLYKAMVRPHVEYASPVWNPALVKHKRAIENVQRRATKLVSDVKDHSYPERLRELGLPTLEYRRLRADMVQLYRLTHGLEGIAADRLVDMNNQSESRRTRGHNLKINKERTNTARYANSFRHRVVNNWNSLPENVVNSPSLNSFKSRLNNTWKNHEFKFTNSF